MEAHPHCLESIDKVKQYEVDLWAVARCYDEDLALSEQNFYEEFEAAITFPTSRGATSWNLDDHTSRVEFHDRSIGILLPGKTSATSAVRKWALEAKKSCVIWDVKEMRNAYCDPGGNFPDKKEVVAEDGRVCDLLQNPDLLDLAFNQDLANKLMCLLHKQRKQHYRRLIVGSEEER
jgi:hypothetical protein